MKKIINKLFDKLGYVPKSNYKTINLDPEWRAFKLDGIKNIDLIVENSTARIPSDTLQSLGYEYAILCTKNVYELLSRNNQDEQIYMNNKKC